MNARCIILPLTALMLAPVALAVEAAPAREQLHPEWAAHFKAEGVSPSDGAAVVFEERRGIWHRFAPARCATRLLPASTFKVFNTMAGIEAGVVPDEHFALKWDGKRREIDSWNQDLDLRKAFQFSAVWFYQEIARRVGPERMGGYLRRENYGNADMTGGLSTFWLSGGLRISPNEQVGFLRRLNHGELGFPAPAQSLTKSLMVNAETETGTVYGKTGWVRGTSGPEVGWWVGFVETAQGTSYFALNIATRDPKVPMGPVRKKVANRIMATLGLPAAK